MRTTFGRISLFTDNLSSTWQDFIRNGKGLGETNSRETERERGKETECLAASYGVGNKLDCCRKYLWQLEKDNPRSYQYEHLDYLQEFRWLWSFSWCCAFLSSRQANDIQCQSFGVTTIFKSKIQYNLLFYPKTGPSILSITTLSTMTLFIMAVNDTLSNERLQWDTHYNVMINVTFYFHP